MGPGGAIPAHRAGMEENPVLTWIVMIEYTMESCYDRPYLVVFSRERACSMETSLNSVSRTTCATTGKEVGSIG